MENLFSDREASGYFSLSFKAYQAKSKVISFTGIFLPRGTGSHSWIPQKKSYSHGIFFVSYPTCLRTWKQENCNDKVKLQTFIRDFSNHLCYAIQFAVHFAQAMQ